MTEERRKSALLYGVVALVFLNLLILGMSSAIILSNQYFTAGRFVFTYDESKLAIEFVGGFVYDNQGNVDSFTIKVRNKDPQNSYSGILEVQVEGQFFQVTIESLKPGKTRTFVIDLDPNLPPDVLAVNATIFVGGGGVTDLVAPVGSGIADAAIDGSIGTEWDDAKQYTASLWIPLAARPRSGSSTTIPTCTWPFSSRLTRPTRGSESRSV